MLRYGIVILCIYLVLCTCVFFLQRKLLYFPQPAINVAGTAPIAFEVEGATLRGSVVNPGREKALLYYGGNAEQIEQNVGFFKSILPEYSVYLISYRGYGNSTGTPTEANLYHDAESVYDTIAKQHGSVAVMGRSLGSGIATYIATKRSIEKLILVTPYDSIENVAKESYWMFPVSLLIKDKFPSWQRAKDINVATLILVAEKDRVISRQRTDNLATHFLPALLTTVIVAGADHNDISLYSQFKDAVRAFLD